MQLDRKPFFQDLGRFGDAPSLIVADTGETLSYLDLAARVDSRKSDLGTSRKLVFIEAHNDIGSIVDYLACLQGGHVVYLLEDLSSPKVQELVDFYKPNIVIDGQRSVRTVNEAPIVLHPDLAVLLSTSGSTGSPKFVKLSVRNIDSNARSIAEYLELKSDERAFQHLKPFYSYGLSIINSHIACGGALILTQFAVMEETFWHEFDQHKATSFAGVPYTFETLKHSGFRAEKHPSLRYATQAGGKLEAGLVQEFAKKFEAAGARFYVMYGQTEAAPRISYLPPALAAEFPASIGKAIPGGRLYLIDEEGDEITETDREGELAYEGPNVMLGYATSPEELATDETPERLKTGDLAEIRDHGLFFIVGRASRFVKPFGVRVNLDEVQSYLKRVFEGVCAVTGDDRHIIIAIEETSATTNAPDIAGLAKRFNLPDHIFKTKSYEKLPVFASGKYDYRRILQEANAPEEPPESTFIGKIFNSVKEILGLNQPSWNTISEIYETMLPRSEITPAKRFIDLAVDSLTFVSLAIEMEEMFGGELPENWQEMTVAELEKAYLAHVVEVENI